VMWAWLRMLCSVPTGISDFLGTMAGVDHLTGAPHELDMATLLAGFDKTDRFKTALDLAEGLGSKPPQPRPRSNGPAMQTASVFPGLSPATMTPGLTGVPPSTHGPSPPAIVRTPSTIARWMGRAPTRSTTVRGTRRSEEH